MSPTGYPRTFLEEFERARPREICDLLHAIALQDWNFACCGAWATCAPAFTSRN